MRIKNAEELLRTGKLNIRDKAFREWKISLEVLSQQTDHHCSINH